MDGVPAFRFLAILVVPALLTAGAPGAAGAQQETGNVVGTVVDETDGTPLEGATVSVINGDTRTETDDEGQFILDGVPTGYLTVRVEQPGYSNVVKQTEVTGADVSFLRFRLPRMEAMLREIMVRARGGDPAESGAEVRGRDDSSRTAADLLAQEVPGVEIAGGEGNVGSGAGIRIRGVSSISLSNSPAVYLDGIRIDEGNSEVPAARGMVALHVLQTIPADEVERIRVLRGPSAAARYADSANGVILVETRRGDGGDGDGDGGGDG